MICLINLTPHAINLHFENNIMQIQPSGEVARVNMTDRPFGFVSLDEPIHRLLIPINKVAYGKVEGLPEPQDGVIYIVSAMVAQAVPDRDDVVFPYDLVRDEQGQVKGARTLAMFGDVASVQKNHL